MTIAPVELPTSWPIRQAAFGLKHFQTSGMAYGGAGQTSTFADPVWEAKYTTREMQELEAGEIEGFLGTLRGMARVVLAYDVRRPVPYAFKGQGGSPWGSPTLASFSRANGTLTMENWTVDMTLYAGDYIAFQDTDDRWHLHRVLTTVVVDGSGDVVAVVEPRPARNLATDTDAPLRIRNSCCTMVFTWDAMDAEQAVGEGRSIPIIAHQVTRAFV